MIPSSYPINAIYQWTGGPEEVMLRVALKNGGGCRRRSAEGAAPQRSSAAEMPGRAVLVRAGRHRQRGHELRLAHARRGGGQRPEPGGRPGLSPTKVRDELARIPSLRDLQYAQTLDYPTVSVDIDRERAGISGVTVEEVARSLVTATSSSRFVVPNYWPDPKTGIGYQVQVEIPYADHELDQAGRNDPGPAPGGRLLLLRDVARVAEGRCPANTTATT